MSQIPQSYIDAVLTRADIVDVIDSRIQIKKAGKNWFGPCPFHDEKSGSFSVNQEKQFFYCFGCGASGDAIAFIMKYEGLDFPVAAKKLGDQLGLTLDPDKKKVVYIKNERKLRGILDSEKYLIKFFKASQQCKLIPIEQADIDRVKLAIARVKKINETLNNAV